MGAPWPGVTTDGVFTVQTRDAIMDFQKAVGIPPTGVIDERLVRSIFDFSINRKPQLLREQYCRQQWRMQTQREAEEQARRQAQAQRQAQMPAPSPVPNSESNWPTLETFVAKCTEQWNGISADIYTIVTGFGLKYSHVQDWGGWLYGQIKGKLAPKLVDFVEWILQQFSFLKGKIVNGWEVVSKFLKTYGGKIIKALGEDPEKVKNWTIVAKSKDFVKSNWVGILLAGLPTVYYLIRRLFAEGSEKDYYEKKLGESIDSFIGAIIVMLICELIAAGIIAIGAMAGVALEATIVGIAVGIVMSILDILTMIFSGKGIGDWAMIAIHNAKENATKVGKTVSRTLEDIAWGYINALNPMNLVGF